MHVHQDLIFPDTHNSMKDTSQYRHIFPDTRTTSAYSGPDPFWGIGRQPVLLDERETKHNGLSFKYMSSN